MYLNKVAGAMTLESITIGALATQIVTNPHHAALALRELADRLESDKSLDEVLQEIILSN